jgi:hypothetical protein
MAKNGRVKFDRKELKELREDIFFIREFRQFPHFFESPAGTGCN